MDRFGKLVRTERKITHLVLECIAEIDRRKIYLEQAFPSLYEFLVTKYGYSPSAAVRRIESARLLRDLPQIAEKIESGSLNLSQLSKVQQAVRTVQKTKMRKVSAEEKIALLSKIEYTTQNQTELILAQELSLPVVHENKQRVHADQSVTLTVTFSPEQMAVLEEAKNLVSHAVDANWAEVLVYLAERETIHRKGKTPKLIFDSAMTAGNASQFVTAGNISAQQATAATEAKTLLVIPHPTKVEGKTTTKLPQRLRRQIMNRDQCCQFRDANTGKVCGSRKFLQIDHRQPLWAGGGNEQTNLQILCAAHNQNKYRKESGIRTG